MFVCICVPPIRVVHPGTSSWVALFEVLLQFPVLVIEHKQYYNEMCMSHSRHYIIILHDIYNTKIVGVLKIVAVLVRVVSEG